MTLKEAIENLFTIAGHGQTYLTKDNVKAIRLGNEALKFYQGAREAIPGYKGILLPGETEE